MSQDVTRDGRKKWLFGIRLNFFSKVMLVACLAGMVSLGIQLHVLGVLQDLLQRHHRVAKLRSYMHPSPLPVLRFPQDTL